MPCPPRVNFPISIISLISIISFISLPSCREPVEQPSLAPDKMARVMADLYLAEAATVGLSGYAKDSLQHVYYQQVFEMHGVTLDEYDRNLKLYADDIDKMQKLVEDAELLVDPAARDTTKK